jgi:hypothetical protein
LTPKHVKGVSFLTEKLKVADPKSKSDSEINPLFFTKSEYEMTKSAPFRYSTAEKR